MSMTKLFTGPVPSNCARRRSIHPRVPSATAWAALLASLALPCRAFGGEEPDPLEILRKADAATLAVASAAYNARHYGTGDLEQRPRAAGAVKVRQGRRGLLGALTGSAKSPHHSLRVTGEWTEPRAAFARKFDVATDGCHCIALFHDDKKYQSADWDKGGDRLMRSGSALFMLEYMHPTPFNDEIVGLSRTYEGRQDVGGEECHVIYVRYLNDSESRWYFSVNDYLPRRVDRIVNAAGKIDGAITLEISDLKVDCPFELSDFRPRPPAGYQHVPYELPRELEPIKPGTKAPDWQLKSPDGNVVELNDLKGRIVVLQFWSPESYPSLIAMPGTQWLADRFKDAPVQVFALACQDAGRDAAKCLNEKQIKVPLLLHADKVAEAYHVSVMPTTYVICPMGYIITSERGYQYKSEEKIALTVDEVLKQSGKGK